MHAFNLRTGYHLAAYPDFESAFAATDIFLGQGSRIAYLNEVAYIRDHEIEDYVLKYATKQAVYYHNYQDSEYKCRKRKATSSLKTALHLLEKRTRQQAKFVVVVAPRHKKIR